MNKITIILCMIASIAWMSCSDEKYKMPWEDDLNNKGNGNEEEEMPEAEVGAPLPKWTDGCLDIHLINSGRGECNFFILPDGTTLIVDAGEIVVNNGTQVPQKPDADTRPYITYAKYISHFLPDGSTAIDWCAPSHFHIDHIGSSAAATSSSDAGYRMSGLTALYEEIPFSRILDLGYPNYGEDTAIPEMDGELAGDWEVFVKWAVANKGVDADRFRAGEEQITLLKDKDAYTNFRIFNIIANGYAWNLDSSTGQGAVVNANAAKGNPASCGFHLTYGKFDYIGCGDLTSGPQNRMAYYYRDFVSKGNLDVFKANHHLAGNSWGSQMQNCEFTPRVIINHSFYLDQPDADMLANVVSGNFPTHPYTWSKDIFTTNLHPDALSANAGLYANITGYNGHIVVRVAPGGAEYYVYMLGDTDFEYKVTSIHGPYSSN